jgi:hypothetical protein
MEPDRTRQPKIKLEELLLRHGAIDEAQLKQALEERKKWGGDIGRILVELGFISEEFLMRALGHQLGLPISDPSVDPLDPDVVCSLTLQTCERFGVIAIAMDLERRVLRVATSEPGNAQELIELGRLTGHRVEAATATAASIAKAIRKYYYGEGLPKPAKPNPAAPPAVAAPKAPAKSPSGGTDPPHLKPRVPRGAEVDRTALDALEGRLARLEGQIKPLKEEILQVMTSNPHFAAITARLERLEQVATTELHVLRVLGDILVERGLISKEEYLTRIREKKKT